MPTTLVRRAGLCARTQRNASPSPFVPPVWNQSTQTDVTHMVAAYIALAALLAAALYSMSLAMRVYFFYRGLKTKKGSRRFLQRQRA